MKILPVIAVLLAGAASAVGFHWLFASPVSLQTVRDSTEEGSIAEQKAERLAAKTDIAGVFTASPELKSFVPAQTPEWPSFRGPNRDNIAPGFEWKNPKILWQLDVGDGHAAPVVSNGRVAFLDYDEKSQGDLLRVLSLRTGRELWRRFYKVKTKRNHGISRTVCATDGDALVSFGPQCHVLCADLETGAFRWGMNLAEKYGSKVPLWYAGQCPLINGNTVVLAPASEKTLLCAVDLKTGAVLFETPGVPDLGMSHASVMTLGEMYIYAGIGGIAGVSKAGKLLWVNRDFTPNVMAPSPCILSENRFFMTAGYGVGGALFEADEKGCRLLFRTDRRTFSSEQQTPICRDGLLYSVLPGDAGGLRQQFACMTSEGKQLWTSGSEDRFGLGPFVAIGRDRFILQDDLGTLTLALANADGYKRLERLPLMNNEGRDAWGPMAVSGNYLLVRDSTRLFCLQMEEKQ